MNERAPSSRASGMMPAFAPAIGLREVLEAAPDLVFCCDALGRFAWASPAFEEFSGRRASELVGAPFSCVLPPEERMRTARHFLKARKAKQVVTKRDVTLVRGDGSSARVRAKVRLLDRPDGEAYFVGIARELDAADAAAPVASSSGSDASRLLELPPEALAALEGRTPLPARPPAPDPRVRELETQLEDARSAANLKGEFLATMSHEIRTPMNGVIGMSSMLMQGELTPEQRHLVEVIHHSCQSLVLLVNDTLDYSRIEAGKLTAEVIDFDLRVTIDQVSSLLGPMAEARGLQFEVKVDPRVPSRVKGDPGRIRQVLLNLGGNAVKFTEKGSVALQIERMREDDHDVTLAFRVVDSGIGIPPDQLARLFQAFTQADNSVARRFGGSGLGLAISRRLVQIMGGEVGVESQANAGSTFWFRLTLEKQRHAVTPSTPIDVQLRGLRVLVADGSPSERRSMSEILGAWGCECEEAENGVEALSRVRAATAARRPYAIALLDMQLEGLGGDDLGQAIRADSDLDSTLLMLTTPIGRPGDAARMREMGFSAYLLKPVDVAQLFDAFAEVVAGGHAQLPPAERPLVTRHSLAEAKRGRLRILLVEDDAVNQLVTKSALNRVGYNVEIASTGRAAIEMTEGQHWDLILMDMQMPGLDGCRATEAIRARERGSRRTPILGLTGNAANSKDRELCLASGMDDVFGKPLDLAALTAAVERRTLRSESRAGERKSAEPAAAEPAPVVEMEGPKKLTVISGRFDPPAATTAARPPAALPAAPDGPAIDVEQLDVSSMGLPALRTSLLHTYLGDVFPRLMRLEEALEASDVRRVEFESHGLRGMCATIGATGCVTLIGEMEEWARDERIDDCKRLLPLVVDEVRRTEEFIRRLERIMTDKAA